MVVLRLARGRKFIIYSRKLFDIVVAVLAFLPLGWHDSARATHAASSRCVVA